MILFVDSSTNNGMLAIAEEKEGDLRVLSKINFEANLNYSEKLFTAFDFLKESLEFELKDIKKIIITVGPGSFTGLRIAYSFAKAISLTTGAEFIGVSTLWAYMFSLPNIIEKKIVLLKSTARDLFLLALNKDKIVYDEQLISNEDLKTLDIDDYLLTGYLPDDLKIKYLKDFDLTPRGMYMAYLNNNIYENINYIKKSYAEC